MTSDDFGTALVATARKYLYVRETSPNSDNGGFVDTCLHEIGLPPGNSWCAAAICKWVRDTATEQKVTVVFHRSARAMGLWQLNQALVITDYQPGDILIEDHGGGLGHVGIITDIVKVNGVIGSVSTIAGNTSADGLSRNGDRVGEHEIPWPDPKLAGCIRILRDS